jgi:Ca-activated chloride channel family protein
LLLEKRRDVALGRHAARDSLFEALFFWSWAMNRALGWSCFAVLLCGAEVGWAQEKSKGAKKVPNEKASSAQPDEFLRKVQKLNADRGAPPSNFRKGHVTARRFDPKAVSATPEGFSIKMPSGTPVPTPAVGGGRLYSGGGFSCKEFYCFDAHSGKPIWGVDLDDDGPSSPILEDDTVLFNTESCTMFALDAATGQLLWAHWLGDPLMSMPAAGGGRVFTAYPVPGDRKGRNDFNYALAAFDLRSGKLLWQRWIDSDCISAPVIRGDDVFLATLLGNVYCFAASDGEIKSAQEARATSAPVVAGADIFFTRRDDSGGKDKEVCEAVAAQDLRTAREKYVSNRRVAAYLDERVQRKSAESTVAKGFEAKNGIGGGFAGGFGAASKDALSVVQGMAATNIGKGNVHTIQAFQGSRLLHWGSQNFNCMGDTVLCMSASSGELVWSRPLSGDLKKVGGHLGAPPVAAGGQLFVAQLSGDISQVDPKTGEVAKKYNIGSSLRFPPVIEAGWLYIGTQDGRLVAVNAGDTKLTGWPMWGGDAGHSGVCNSAP